jgi:rubrerythrin
MPQNADYFRARAMEERAHARDADRVYLAKVHQELAKQLDRRAEECDAVTEDLNALAERASSSIKQPKS